MKNIKLTLATTLSILTLAFTGTAFADGDREYNHFERQVDKSNVQNIKNKRDVSSKKYASSDRKTKRVVVKNTPTRKVIVTKTIIKSLQKSDMPKTNVFSM